MIELHSFFSCKKRFLERNEQISWECYVVSYGHELQYDIYGKVDFAELSLGRLVRTIEDKQMKNLTNFYYMLESINIGCNEHDIVIRKRFKKRDDSDERARMFSAFPTSEVQDRKEKTNYIMAMLLIVERTATTSNTIWMTVVKRSCYESRVGVMVVVYIIIIINLSDFIK